MNARENILINYTLKQQQNHFGRPAIHTFQDGGSKIAHGRSKITLIENDRIVSENNKIAKTFRMYFESVTDSSF